MNWSTYVATVLTGGMQERVIVVAKDIREALDQVELKYPNSTFEIVDISKGGQR